MYKNSQFDVLVIGTTCIDLVFSHMPSWPMPGDQFGVKKFAAHSGDAFCGGFMYGWVKGYIFHDALRCGNICGSLSTTALTGTAAIPTAKQLEIYMQKEPG